METVARKVNFGGWRRKTLDELFEGFTLMESGKEKIRGLRKEERK